MLQNINDKVRIALEVYLQRGQAAITALNDPDTNSFFVIMERRDAAFHNFRALDAVAAAAGIDIASDPRLRRLWSEIEQTNRTLKGRMEETQAEMGQRLSRLRASRAPTQAYHSGTPAPLRLVKQI